MNGDPGLLGAALDFALEAHAGQTRKGSDVPYATHVMRVGALVLEHGGDTVQAAAGLLHDTIEDCAHVTGDVLHVRFGAEVAGIVVALTDTLPGDTPDRKSPWRDRKEAYLARLPGLGERGQLVAACDKLDNLRALITDLRAHGVVSLERFSSSPRQTRWYYESVRVALDPLPPGIVDEFDALLAEFAGHVGEVSIER